MTYSVLTFKATRGASVIGKGLDYISAMNLLDRALEFNRAFFLSKLMVSGVAILLMKDEDAEEINNAGIIMLSDKQVLFQAGSY